MRGETRWIVEARFPDPGEPCVRAPNLARTSIGDILRPLDGALGLNIERFRGTHCLVTGGAGMIGSNLVKRLVGLGARVTAVDNLWRGRREHLLDEQGNPVIDLEEDFHEIDLTVPERSTTCSTELDPYSTWRMSSPASATCSTTRRASSVRTC